MRLHEVFAHVHTALADLPAAAKTMEIFLCYLDGSLLLHPHLPHLHRNIPYHICAEEGRATMHRCGIARGIAIGTGVTH
jgi:hypothetical protein